MLDLWLMVTLLACMPNFLVAIIGSSIRFTIGWYAARGFILVGSCMLLTVLLVETTLLYSRLASAIILRRRERTNRLLSVDAITAAIAHELRTPLGAISLNANTALSQLRSNPPELEEMDEILTDIDAESHRAAAIISSVRQLSKTTPDRRAPTRVEDVARLVLRLLQHDLQINEVSVVTEFQDNLPEVHLDDTQLQQVLLNLIKNAIDAMSSVAPEARRLRLTTRFNGHSTVMLSVQDSGPGILVEDRERYSIRSLRRNPGVWDLDSRSVLPWSKTTEANCDSSSRTPTARFLSSQYQSASSTRLSRHHAEACRHVGTTTAVRLV